MKAGFLPGILLVLSLGLTAVADDKENLPEGVIKETYDLRTKGTAARLNLYLKYPSGGKEAVQGVIIICKFGDREIEFDLTGEGGRFGYLLEFAEQNQLAMVAFGQPARRGWNRTVSSDQLSSREAAEQDRKLDASAREWSRIVGQFARKYGIPENDWLMYGLCGGAQYAHRIALREPERFKAVHVHYGGSYDIPTPRAKDLFWLVTSRADEPAYIAAQRFYRKAREMNYNMILKGYNSRNAPRDFTEQSESNLQNLSVRFFNYALRNDEWDRTSEEAYTADYVNGIVVPAANAGWIPREQSVDLPSRAIASAWGEISDSN